MKDEVLNEQKSDKKNEGSNQQKSGFESDEDYNEDSGEEEKVNKTKTNSSNLQTEIQ